MTQDQYQREGSTCNHQQIEWIEDQPSIRHVKDRLHSLGLIQNLVELIREFDLRTIRATMFLDDQSGRNLYICSVATNSDLDYYLVSLERSDLGTADAVGKIYKGTFGVEL